MNVLMTTDTLGGVWNYAIELCRALEPHDAHVTLATLGRRTSPDQREAVERLPNVDVFESEYKLEWMADPWDDVRAAGNWLERLAEDVQPDVVHLNDYAHGVRDWPAPVLMVGHSCVLSWHRAVRGCDAGPEWRAYREAVAAGLRAADLVVAPTRAMLNSLREHYGPLRETAVVWNGVRSTARAPVRKQPVVFSAGRLWDEGKNVAAVAEAAAEMRWPVEIAGEQRHPDGGTVTVPHATLLGRLTADEMRERYRRASIYVWPARYEPFGLTPLEAACAGCALVLGDLPTLREVWGRSAVFVDPDDPAELTRAVNRLVDDDWMRQDYALRARFRAQRLTAERMAEAYVGCYRRLADSAVPWERKTREFVGGLR